MRIQMTTKERHEVSKWMDMPVEDAAKHLKCTEAQARAAMEFVILVCMMEHEKRDPAKDHNRIRARAIMRCMAPGVRGHLPDSIRFYL